MKIKEANENNEEISTGRKMSKLYFNWLLHVFQVEVTYSIDLDIFMNEIKELFNDLFTSFN